MHDGELVPGFHADKFQFVSFLILNEYPYTGIGGDVVVRLDGGVGRSFCRRGIGGSGGKLISPRWSGWCRIPEFWGFETMFSGGCTVRSGNFLPRWRGVGQGGRWSGAA